MAKQLCANPNCDVVFEAKRSSARFHSDKCRVEAARLAGADPETGEVIEPGTKEAKKIPNYNPPVTLPGQPERYDRAKNLAAFQKMGLAKTEWITSGIAELDAFQMIPRGRVTQIQGPYAVGKTTLALNMIRGLRNKKVFYVDSEASLNPELLVDLELDPRYFHLYNESAYIEDMYDQVISAAKSGVYDLIILDSLAACTTKTEEEGDATASNIGQKAKIVNKLMRIVPMELKNTDTALVIINQEREVIGSYVPQKYTPGGMGPVYAASLILGLKTIPSWRFPKDAKNGVYKGHEIEVTVLKSKVSQPHRKTKIKLYYLNPEAELKETVDKTAVDNGSEPF